MLTRALDLHAEAEKPRDRDWITLLLEYLKAYVQDLGKALLITKEDHIAYTSSLIGALSDSARTLKTGTFLGLVFNLTPPQLLLTDMDYLDHPAISLSVPNKNAHLADTRDGAVLEVTVNNALPCVCLCFV